MMKLFEMYRLKNATDRRMHTHEFVDRVRYSAEDEAESLVQFGCVLNNFGELLPFSGLHSLHLVHYDDDPALSLRKHISKDIHRFVQRAWFGYADRLLLAALVVDAEPRESAS